MMENSFFEDETSVNEEKEEGKKVKVGRAKKLSSSKAAGKGYERKGRREGEQPSLGIVWVTILILFSFFLGFSLGMWVIPALTGGTTQSQTQQEQVAPPLSPEQVQQGLPEGHPPVGGTSTPSGTSTGTAP